MAWVLPRPRLVLGIAVVSAVLSFGYAVTHLEVETDQLELISTHHPLITLSDKLDTFEPGGEQSLSVVIEAPSPERGISFLLALVHRIKEDTLHFENVFYRVDPDLFKHWAFSLSGQAGPALSAAHSSGKLCHDPWSGRGCECSQLSQTGQ